MRCVVYFKGLSETHMTLDSRLLLLLLLLLLLCSLLLLLRLRKPKTGHAGNFTIVDIFNAEKNQRRILLVESVRRIIRVFW